MILGTSCHLPKPQFHKSSICFPLYLYFLRRYSTNYFLNKKNECISTVVLVYNVQINTHMSVVNAQELFTGKGILLVKFGVL